MSPKNSSLAFDEALKEYGHLEHSEPTLTVLVNSHYAQASLLTAGSADLSDVVLVQGSITISF